MALVIGTNVAAMESQRNLAQSQAAQSQNFTRLSSGMRINTAADDAAGLAISESLKSQVRSFSVAERNANNAVSMAQTAESALGQVGNIIGRMRELAVQGGNGDLGATDRDYLNTEFTQLKDEITRIVDSTTFNGKALLSGAAANTTFQVGINNTSSDRIDVEFGGSNVADLGLTATAVDGATAANAQSAIDDLDGALQLVSEKRANLGASINRFGSAVANIQSMKTNLSAANSRIRDVDVAEETAAMSRNQVLSQASVAVLAQANQAPQMALSLLR